MLDRERAILTTFASRFGDSEGAGLARAPGRVNIIGEHTDYNGGFVLPMAIARDTLVAFKPNGTRTVHVHSMTFDESSEFSLEDVRAGAGPAWRPYVAGVAGAFQEANVSVPGLDMVVHSTVPIGGGLSSSAALEVSTALAFLAAAGVRLEKKKIALICQRAENAYAGMNCGIMDQYVALFGQKGAAVKLDCRALEHELVPLEVDSARFVVCDTGVRHELASSEYNKRRRECEEGARAAGKILGRDVAALRDLEPEDLPALEGRLDPVVFRRVRHVVTEDRRVHEAARAMAARDCAGLGELMNASHDSLRDDYEVSCAELDTLVEVARSHSGVFGSRMTGGGFGGCTITLVDAERVEHFREEVARAYERTTGRIPAATVCTPEAGAAVLREPT